MKLKYLILLGISGVIISLDQLTKQIVLQKILYNDALSVIPGFFDLTHVHNTGAAFGLLSKIDASIRVPLFLIVPGLALLIIAMVFRKLEDKALLLAFALSLVIGGAVGNLIDRAAYNYVIDFLLFHWKSAAYFPAFNVADIAICVGVGILILDIIKREGEGSRASSPI